MSLMIDKCLEHLVQKLNEKVRSLEESLGAGTAKDYAEYQNVCGQIKGLLYMRIEIADLKQRMENSDE
jgi:hypothetical protein